MPIVNFYNAKSGISCNKGSCWELLEHLLHKNDEYYSKNCKHLDDSQFKLFDAYNDAIPLDYAVKIIDGNNYGLSKKDAKFYLADLNFSQGEIGAMMNVNENSFINMENSIKSFVRNAFIPKYAANFKGYRDKNYNEIEFKRDDIVWVAIIHSCRLDRHGNLKNGPGWHAQVVISHRNKGMTRSLSPTRNHRKSHPGNCQGAFDRSYFQKQIEKAIDEQYSYKRPFTESVCFNHGIIDDSFEKKIIEVLNKADKLLNSYDKKSNKNY